MIRRRFICALIVCAAAGACDKSSPPPTPAPAPSPTPTATPSPTPTPPPTPTPGERVTGSERFGWDQQAIDAVELASFRYAIYVDGTRSELTGASCAPTPTSAGFACAAPLPAMSQGP